jgi:alkylation response protein AidB-like acyl-CoA dehydrogenase
MVLAASSVGGAYACLKAARDHALVRKQFNKPLSDLQSIQFKLADMATALHASRMLVRDAARKLDAKDQAATVSAAMAKQFATDNCFKVRRFSFGNIMHLFVRANWLPPFNGDMVRFATMRFKFSVAMVT